MRKIFLSAMAIFTLCVSVSAFAGADGHISGIMVRDVQIRATTPQAGATAAYGVIHNHGDHDDTLIGASASFASKTELHEMSLDGDVMKMREITGGIALPAGGMIILKKKSDHLMLMGLTQPISVDESYQITLIFEKAGRITVDAQTIALSGKTKSHDHHDHGHKH